MAGKGTSATLSDLLARPAALRGPRCSIGNILASLTTVDREALVAAIDDPSISLANIARAMTDYLDRRIDVNAVARHRRRGEGNGCACPR